jgi:Secretion system C-terminal sorting domain
MKKSILSFLFAAFFGSWAVAQTSFETFETGSAGVTWSLVNSVSSWGGAIANPDATGANTSAMVGAVTNNPLSDFTFLLGTPAVTPIDLKKFSQIKINVWSPVAGHKILFKMEGGGKGVEQFLTIPVANQWVEMSVNLNCGVDFPALDKILIAFNPFTTNTGETYYFDNIRAVGPGSTIETFEGSSLPWVAFGGSALTLNEPNPGANSVNSSATCAKFVRNPAEQWTLAINDFGTPFNLSTNNQFKLKIYASQATEILFKIEGAGGNKEVRKNIGLTNAWQDYSFDLSSLDTNSGITKVVLFFAPGTSTDGTYYFDDLRIEPKDCACKSAIENADIIDDYECNRHATYTNGWDSLSVVANPLKNADNPSSLVGKYLDPVGEAYAALGFDNENNIDLATKNQLRAKIWCPKTCKILFKLEGGSSAPKEIWKDVTTPNVWVNYEVDFSSQAAASQKKLFIFFNGGEDGVAGDVYYIDDIEWMPKTNSAIDDFENGTAFLPWEPLDQNIVLNGIFSVNANPSATGINTSTMVGKYTKGSSAFSTLAAVAPGFIDISSKPQFNLDVWAPAGSKKVTMQLESVSQGNKEVTRNITNAGNWETLNFDFTANQAVTDWASLRLIFDGGTAAPLTMYFFDNLTQGAATVDPCEGTVPNLNLVDDFECQRNFGYTGGAGSLSVVNNPLNQTVNQSTKSGKYIDPANDPYAALVIEFPLGINLDLFNQFEITMKAPAAGLPVVFKLEGGASGGFESPKYFTTGTDWVKVTTDFSAQAGGDYKKLVIFFNFAEQGASADWFIDNLKWARAAFNGCIATFESPGFTPNVWKFFENGTLTPAQGFEVAANPSPTGIDKTPTVGKATEAGLDNGGSQPWGGMFTDLDAPMRFTNSVKKMRMKVLMPALVQVTMKLENAQTAGVGGTGDNNVLTTKVGEWEQLEWDFSAAADNADYQRVTLIWNIDAIPATNQVYYFDDIQMVGGTSDCQVSGTLNPTFAPLEIFPNPTNDFLFVKNMDKIARLDIVNLLGQHVSVLAIDGAETADLNVANLQKGVYLLIGYGSNGQILANAKFIKA